ncbi:MAG: carboxypeptidase-like regulatory domain-containing protein, partial [Bacteroidetes bacterium]|nr:carboxypeptidase-like regulatory domain-containing protein [Bacteroidota bacterium]
MTRLWSLTSSLSLFLLLLAGAGLAQSGARQFTVSGYVKDAASGEALQNATVTANPGGIAVQSNAYGYFSLFLPEGKYTITASFAGYTAFQQEINLSANTTLNVTLASASGAMEEVVITGEKKLRRTNTVGLGIQQLSMGQIKKIPAFMGEPDVLKALLTQPGVTSIGEGAAGFNVRGGNVDENLIIMDEAPVFNSS